MARPRSFEKQDVLSKAMNLFWDQGYRQASLKDLEDLTGLKAGSLYNIFDSKEELFEETVEYYFDTVIDKRLRILDREEAISNRIKEFLDDVVEQSLQDNKIPGCLLTNSALEILGLPETLREALRDKIQNLEETFVSNFREAKHNRELIQESEPERLAHYIVGVIQGINVLGRTYSDQQRMEDLANTAVETIRNNMRN